MFDNFKMTSYGFDNFKMTTYGISGCLVTNMSMFPWYCTVPMIFVWLDKMRGPRNEVRKMPINNQTMHFIRIRIHTRFWVIKNSKQRIHHPWNPEVLCLSGDAKNLSLYIDTFGQPLYHFTIQGGTKSKLRLVWTWWSWWNPGLLVLSSRRARLLFASPYVDEDRRSSPADDLDQGRRTGEQRAPQAWLNSVELQLASEN